MFTIYVTTNDGHKKEYSIIDRDLAIFYFKAFMQALDLKNVVMTDGLTGEIIYDYSGNKFTVFDCQCVDEKWMR